MPPSVADEKGRCRSEQGGEGASPWGTLYVYIPMDRVVSSQVRYDWTLQTYMTVSPITVVEKVHGSLYIHIFFSVVQRVQCRPTCITSIYRWFVCLTGFQREPVGCAWYILI